MIFKGSRYAGTVVIQASTFAGERRALALRRIPAAPGVLEHIVMDGERLDQLAARFYGDPVKYWLLLDANPDELNPLALLRPGRRIAVPSDRAGGRMIAEAVRISIGGAAQDDLASDLTEVRVEEVADGASVFSLRVATVPDGEGSWSHLDDPQLALWKRVTVEAGYEAPYERIADGHVTHVDAALSDDADGHIEVSGMDAGALMDLEERQLAWKNKKDSDIAGEIFGSYSLSTEIEDSVVRHDEATATILQTESDIRFLRRLAARNGFECRVRGRTGVFRPPDYAEPPQKVLALAFGAETNLVDLRASLDGTPASTVEIRRVDPMEKRDERRTLAQPAHRKLGRRTLGDLRTNPGGRAFVRDHASTAIPELESRLRAAHDAAGRFVTVEGEIDARAYRAVLRPGRLVTVKGAGPARSGLYYVSRVSHVFTADGYVQRFWAHRNGLGLTGEEQFAMPRLQQVAAASGALALTASAAARR